MATKIEGKLESFNELFEHVQEHFKNEGYSIHNLLWQIIINRVNENQDLTFHFVYNDGNTYIVWVYRNEPGYQNTHVQFGDHLKIQKIREVVIYLNEKLYGHTMAESEEIVNSSFCNIL